MKRWFILFGLCAFSSLFAVEEPLGGRIRLDDEWIAPPQRERVIQEIRTLWAVCQAMLPPNVNGPTLVIKTLPSDELPVFENPSPNRVILKLPLHLVHLGFNQRSQAIIADAMIRILSGRWETRFSPPTGEVNTPDWILAAVLRRTEVECVLPEKNPFPALFPVYPGLAACLGKGVFLPLPFEIVTLSFSPADEPSYALYGELSDLLLTYHFAAPHNVKPKLLKMLQKSNPGNRNSNLLYQLLAESVPQNLRGEPVLFRHFSEEKIFSQTLHRTAGQILSEYQNLKIKNLFFKEKDLNSFKSKIRAKLSVLIRCAPYTLRRELNRIDQMLSELTPGNSSGFPERLKQSEKGITAAAERDAQIASYLENLEKKNGTIPTHFRRQQEWIRLFHTERLNEHTQISRWLDAVEAHDLAVRRAVLWNRRPNPDLIIENDSPVSFQMEIGERNIFEKKDETGLKN